MSAYICPQHQQTVLIGGPVLFECSADGGHSIYAADLPREFQPQAVAS